MTTPGPTGGPKGQELNHLDYMATFRFHKRQPLIPCQNAPLSIQGNPVKLEGLSREIFGVHGCSKVRFHLCK